MFLAGSGFIIVGFTALAQEVLFVLVPPVYYLAFIPIPYLAAGFVFFTSAHVSVVAIMAKNKTVYIMIACWLVALINIGLNALLIPRFGMAGAGAATGIAYMLFAAGYALVSKRLWPVSYPVKTIVLLLAVPLAGIAAIAAIAHHGPGIAVNLLLKLAVLAACGLLLAATAGRHEEKSLRELIQLGKTMFIRR